MKKIYAFILLAVMAGAAKQSVAQTSQMSNIINSVTDTVITWCLGDTSIMLCTPSLGTSY